MTAWPVHLLVLNFNGKDLLAECLPSIVRAANASRFPCEVVVIDNSSTDGSRDWLAAEFPDLRTIVLPNRGLCSFNAVLPALGGRFAILLNNDIRLAPDAVDPLIQALVDHDPRRPIFATAPRCWLFDGETYEGFRTAVSWRAGMVRATALFPGHEQGVDVGGPTASVGAALAVDRQKFLELGGFDPVYLPGRIEDLDLCYRAWQAGYECRYVPAAKAWHRGQATFGAHFGESGNLELALRNTLLFQWKNLRLARHRVAHFAWLPIRLLYDVLRAPFVPRERRWMFARALAGAWQRRGQWRREDAAKHDPLRESEWFSQFSVSRMADATAFRSPERTRNEDARRAANYPLSRWWLRPLAALAAGRLVSTSVRPWHVTLAGLGATFVAAAIAASGVASLAWVGALWLLAWFCDRLDGQLARQRGESSPAGAWFDANIDEFADVLLRAALAAGAARMTGAAWPWAIFGAYAAAKHLFMYGLHVEELLVRDEGHNPHLAPNSPQRSVARLYHAPANADVRAHVLAAALLVGAPLVEMTFYASYYFLRTLWRLARLPNAWRAKHPSAAKVEPPSVGAAMATPHLPHKSENSPAFEIVASGSER